MSVTSRIARNTVTTWMRSILAAAVAFFMVRYLWMHLGKAGYGTSEVITTVVFFTFLSDLGLRAALSRHMAECVARRDIQSLNEHYNAALSCYLVLGILLAAFFGIFAEWLADLLKIDPAERASAVILIRYYVTTSALLSFIIPIYASVLEAHHRFDITDLVQIAEVLIRAIVIVVLLGGFGRGLYGWAIAMLAARACSLVLLATLAYRWAPGLRIGAKYLNRSAYVALFSLGGYLFLHTAIQQVNTFSDPLIVSSFLDSSAVALYKPALLVMTSAYPFVGGLSRQVKPLITSYYATGQEDLVQEVTIRGTRMTLLVGIPFCVIFGAFALPIMQIFLGDEPGADIPTSATVLMLLSLLDLSTHLRETQSFVMTGLNRVRYMALVQTIGGMLAVFCSVGLIWLLRSRGWGDRSMIAVPLPMVCLSWIQLMIITSHIGVETRIGRWRYLVHGFGRGMIVLAITAVFAVSLNHLVQPARMNSTFQSLAALVLCVAATGAVWLAGSWWIGFDLPDKLRMQRMVQSLLSRSSARQSPAGD